MADDEDMKTYAARFWVLSCFGLLAALQGAVWLTFAPVVKEAKEYFARLDDSAIQWMDSYPAVICIPCLLGSTWLATCNDGLRKCMYLGSVLAFVATWLRCGALHKPASESSLWIIHTAHLLNAAVEPLVMVTPSLLSVTWFPPAESTRATAAALLANSIGAALAYVAGPGLVALGGLPALFLSHALLATAVLGCVLVSFPGRPPTPPSAVAAAGLPGSAPGTAGAGAVRRHRLVAATRAEGAPPRSAPRSPLAPGTGGGGYGTVAEGPGSQPSLPLDPPASASCWPLFLAEYSILCCCTDFRILVLVYGWMSGAYIAWVSLFDELLSRDTNYSERYIGLLSFCSNLGYIAGGLASSWLVDTYLRRGHTAVLYYSSGAAALLALLFVLSLPYRAPTLLPTLQLKNGRNLLLAAASGFPIGVIDPVMYEFAAELTYPVSEGSSAALLSVGENLGTLFLLQVLAPCVDPETLNYLFIFGLGLCPLALRLVQPRYLRSAAEAQAAPAGPAAHRARPASPSSPTRSLPEPCQELRHSPMGDAAAPDCCPVEPMTALL